MKENILFIFLAVAGLGAMYYLGVTHGREQIEAKYRAGESRRTTTTAETKVKQPERSATIENKAPVTPQHKIDADSIFNAGLRHGIDSVRSIFTAATVPVDTSVTFDTVGTVHVTYRPLLPGRPLTVKLDPAPIRIVTITNTDSIFVKIPEERPWWKTPAWVIGALAVGWVAHDIAKD